MFAVTPQERLAITWVAVTAFIGIVTHYGMKLCAHPQGAPALNEDICKVRLNTCGADELMTIPGIGRRLAGRIIDYRAKKGRLETITELRIVQGMTARRLAAIMDAAVVE